jgi:hypothetical protein
VRAIFSPTKLGLFLTIVLGFSYYVAYEVISTTLGWKIQPRGLPCIVKGPNPSPVPFISPDVSITDEWYIASHPSECRGSQLEIIFSYVHLFIDFLPFLSVGYISACYIVAFCEWKKAQKRQNKTKAHC